MKLRILTPARAVVDTEVTQVTLPGTAGQLTPLAGHDLLLTPLEAGTLYFSAIDAEGRTERQDYRIGEGGAGGGKDAVTVFTMTAEKPAPAK
jgi:F0F1-type ATP synthase epsilon subunit